MPDRSALPLLLSALAGALALAAAVLGLANLDLYRPMTPEKFLPGTVSQDLFSLVLALGLLCVVARLASRPSARLWALWLGLLGFLGYGYGLYAFESLVNALFLVYVAVFALCVWAALSFFARCERAAFRAEAAPRRLTAALFALLVAMFLALWMAILLPAMAAKAPPDAATIQVFDLSFVLPALGFAAVMLWRGDPWGDLLALPLLLKAATIGLSVLLGTLLSPWFGLPVAAGEVATYAVLGCLPLALTIPWWRALAP